MQPPNHVTSSDLTSKHNPLKWQAMKSALVGINFKKPLNSHLKKKNSSQHCVAVFDIFISAYSRQNWGVLAINTVASCTKSGRVRLLATVVV